MSIHFRLARFDGVEMGGVLLGTFLSPYLFNATGYYGIYIVRLIMVAASLIYWFAYIKSPEELGVVKPEVESEKEKEANADKDKPSPGVIVGLAIFLSYTNNTNCAL